MIPPPYPFPDKWPALFAQRGAHRGPWLTPFTALQQPDGTAPSALDATPPPPPPAFANSWYQRPVSTSAWPDAPEKVRDDQDARLRGHPPASDHEEEDDGEYEYGYVLSDVWRKYLRENVLSSDEEGASSATSSERRSRQLARKQKPKPKQTKRQPSQRAAASRGRHAPAPRVLTQLDVALDEARALEQQRRRNREDRRAENQSSEATAAGSEHVDKAAEERFLTSLRRVEHLETALHAKFEAFCDHFAPAVWPQGASSC